MWDIVAIEVKGESTALTSSSNMLSTVCADVIASSPNPPANACVSIVTGKVSLGAQSAKIFLSFADSQTI